MDLLGAVEPHTGPALLARFPKLIGLRMDVAEEQKRLEAGRSRREEVVDRGRSEKSKTVAVNRSRRLSDRKRRRQKVEEDEEELRRMDREVRSRYSSRRPRSRLERGQADLDLRSKRVSKN